MLELQPMLPELFLLGSYAPEKRTGPALWLRCIEARVVEGAPSAGTTPILYLPGISREKLRTAEDCPQELAALSQLQGRRLDSEFFNGLVAPDATGLLLRWLSDPEAFKQRRSDSEWKAFSEQCKADFRFDPVKEGPLKAAKLLADRGNP
jgi:hypothetical protein